jgi:hypothetical protein
MVGELSSEIRARNRVRQQLWERWATGCFVPFVNDEQNSTLRARIERFLSALANMSTEKKE